MLLCTFSLCSWGTSHPTWKPALERQVLGLCFHGFYALLRKWFCSNIWICQEWKRAFLIYSQTKSAWQALLCSSQTKQSHAQTPDIQTGLRTLWAGKYFIPNCQDQFQACLCQEPEEREKSPLATIVLGTLARIKEQRKGLQGSAQPQPQNNSNMQPQLSPNLPLASTSVLTD